MFYHIPEKLVQNPNEIEYVALYRSKNVFGDNDRGILHVGRVASFSLVKRENIIELPYSRNIGECYYRFEITEWHTLENPIKSYGFEYKYLNTLTSKFLIDNCRFFYELTIENNDQFKIYLGIRDLLAETYDGFFVGNVRAYCNFSKIILYSSTSKISISIKAYKHAKCETLKKIFSFIENQR